MFPFWRPFHRYCIPRFMCWSIFSTAATCPLLFVASLLIFHVPPTKDMQPPTASFHLAVRSRSSVTSRGSQPEQRSPASLPPAKHSQLQWLCLRLQAKLASLITRYWTWICAARSAFGFWNSLITPKQAPKEQLVELLYFLSGLLTLLHKKYHQLFWKSVFFFCLNVIYCSQWNDIEP